jgi:hypothetical protein
MPSPDAKKGRERPDVTKSPRVRCGLYRAEHNRLQAWRLQGRRKSDGISYFLFEQENAFAPLVHPAGSWRPDCRKRCSLSNNDEHVRVTI